VTVEHSEEGRAPLPNLPPGADGAGKAGGRAAPVSPHVAFSDGSLACATLTASVKALAQELGFDRIAIGPAGPPRHGAEFRQWVEAGRAGTMAYLERRIEERLDPARLLPGARSIVCVALNYYQGEMADPSWAPVARYAWGRDYHAVIEPRLDQLAAHLRDAGGARCRAYVDTGPVLERDMAARAGLGWVGKNTMLLHPELGSWFFIGVLLTTADLEHDAPLPDRCGSCRACLDACPTHAFVAPYVLDARRCISYLTIEHRGAIDPALHEEVGQWQFGCDLCQSVCPWNRRAPVTREAAFLPAAAYPGAASVLGMSDDAFRHTFAGTALLRPKAVGMRRNAATALDNARRAIDR
jgi:epoxyqueuosine reductase